MHDQDTAPLQLNRSSSHSRQFRLLRCSQSVFPKFFNISNTYTVQFDELLAGDPSDALLFKPISLYFESSLALPFPLPPPLH